VVLNLHFSSLKDLIQTIRKITLIK